MTDMDWLDMPEVKNVRDKEPEDSAMLPSTSELKASQRKGATGKGMNPSDTKLNEEQGHAVEIKG